MNDFLTISQIVISVLLVISILSQDKGAGLSATFGGGGGGEVYRSKRGIDRILSMITIVLAILFVVNSIAFLFLDDSSESPDSTAIPGIEGLQIETTSEPPSTSE